MISRWTPLAHSLAAAAALSLSIAAAACSDRTAAPAPEPLPRPSILLVTLDTTRADSIGPEAAGISTPAFNALAARGLRFRQAYATVPETLPSHVSMMTGLYPAGHGVHENARPVAAAHALLAELLQGSGYRTAAFVSSFVLARRFGLARGFETYDDELPDRAAERDSAATTDRALAFLSTPSPAPLFLWVHYFDPHAPYVPPDAFRGPFREKPYLGEIAAMDAQIGRLVAGIRTPGARSGRHRGRGRSRRGPGRPRRVPARQPAVSVDHARAAGAGRAGRGARGHGRPGQHAPPLPHPARLGGPRRVATACAAPSAEVVLGEAMKPFLEYGWQPQTMAVEGTRKAILAGTLETYDLAADPREERATWALARRCRPRSRAALEDYPVPSLAGAAGARRPWTTRRAGGWPASATSAPARPRSSAATPRARPTWCISSTSSSRPPRCSSRSGMPRRSRCSSASAQKDPHNLDAALRLATAHSSLGRDRAGAGRLQDGRADSAAVGGRADVPGAALRPRRGLGAGGAAARAPGRRAAGPAAGGRGAGAHPRAAGADGRRDRAAPADSRARAPLRRRSSSGWGSWRCGDGQTGVAIDAFERARAQAGPPFRHDLELGVLYLAARRLPEARAALDRVPAAHPDYCDGALQARAGQRAAEGAGPRRPDRGRAPRRRRHDARVDCEGAIVRQRRCG